MKPMYIRICIVDIDLFSHLHYAKTKLGDNANPSGNKFENPKIFIIQKILLENF